MPAISAEKAGRDGEECRDDAGKTDIDAIDMDQILRQPQGERHKGAEHEEVIKRETPDLNVLEWFQLHQRAGGLFTLATAFDQNGIVVGGEIEDQRHDNHCGRPDFGNRMPAKCNHDHRCKELRHRRADIARAENAERNALLFRWIPARDISDADRERPARHADAEGCEQHLRIGRGIGQEIGGDSRNQHCEREDGTAAIAVRPYAQNDADQRSGQDGRANKQAELCLSQAKLGSNFNADDSKDGPDRKTDCKSGRAHR